MNSNKVLERQLKTEGLSLDSPPANLEQWQKITNRINNYYNDIAQEFYILERSSEISAKETMELNKNLEDAQRLACIGHWHYQKTNNRLILSKEFYTLFGFDSRNRSHVYEELMKYIHYHDAERFEKMLVRSLESGLDGEMEIRIIMPNKSFAWFFVICHPVKNSKGKCDELTGIAMEITKRKEAEKKIETLNQQLFLSARFAGMAEVATSMLHNLGNILNSANVSLNLLKETIEQPHLTKVLMAFDLIKNNLLNIDKYLTTDEKGKLILPYLIASSSVLKQEDEICKNEIVNLSTHLNHIKEIVAIQQNISGFSKLIEKIFLPEVIDLALKMSISEKDETIDIIKKYGSLNFIETDKSKLLQILVNLIRNAKDAILENKNSDKKEINISVLEENNDRVKVVVRDNGIGILEKNYNKIFSFGFTSKKNGHGFGLHSSALFAKELAGDLQVTSEGIGKGATFTLSLPITLSEGNNDERQ